MLAQVDPSNEIQRFAGCKGGPDDSPSSPKAMKSKELLVGKRSPDGSARGPQILKSKDLLVGKGGPDGSTSSPKQ